MILNATTYGVVSVGDIVTRSAKGKLWRVAGFWTPSVGTGVMATLEPIQGYTRSSAPVDQLTVVHRPVDTRPPGVEETPC
jgi:hypothetical protein